MIEGRGRAVGPDLTMIGHSQTREHVLESILEPSKEIAPLYTLWSITTKSGQRIDGMLLRRDAQGLEVYVDATAQEIKVPEPAITDRKMRKESLMPTGLVQHVQLNDRNKRGPGEGDDKFAPVLAALKETGYDGWVAMEPFIYEPDGPTCAARMIGYVSGLLEHST